MIILSVVANPDGTLRVVRDDGVAGAFDVRPYFELEAFEPLLEPAEFAQVRTGGYFVEWTCGADLSADTIEASSMGDLRTRCEPICVIGQVGSRGSGVGSCNKRAPATD